MHCCPLCFDFCGPGLNCICGCEVPSCFSLGDCKIRYGLRIVITGSRQRNTKIHLQIVFCKAGRGLEVNI